MLQCAGKYIRDDLHVPMPMRAEAFTRLHRVVIDDSQRAPTHVLMVVVIREGESVVAIEPAMPGMAALTGFA